MSFARKSGNFTLVQFGTSALSILRVKATGAHLQVTAHAVRHGSWSTDEPAAVSKSLGELAQELGCAQDPAFIILPRHEVTSRIMELPSQDDPEIAGMVRLGAEDLVPYPLAELVTAHHILERLEGGNSRVLVAVVHNDTLNQAIAVARNAGLQVESVLWSTACLFTAMQSLDRASEGVRGLLHLGPAGFEILVMNGSKAEYSRGIASDIRWDEAPSPGTIAELSTELRAALAAHRRESVDGIGASEVFVASDVADVTALATALAEDTGVLCEPAGFAQARIAEGGAPITGIPMVAWGAALTVQGSSVCPIDLTPRVELAKRQRASAKTTAIRVAASLAILFASVGAVYFQAVHQRTTYIAELEERTDALRPRVRDAMNKRRHLERLQQEVARKDTILELVASLCDVAPRNGLNFTNIKYRRDEGITLFGRAMTRGQIHTMAEALRGIGKSSVPQFARASTMYENQSSERNQEVFDYSIALPFTEVPVE